MKTRIATYWTATAILSLCILSGGGAEAVQYQANVANIVGKLGYPRYFLTLIGLWKIAGAVVILVPGLPRLKEWAYAGIFFVVTGAAASHLAAGDYGVFAFHVLVNLGFAALVFVSWALRPANRIIKATPPPTPTPTVCQPA